MGAAQSRAPANMAAPRLTERFKNLDVDDRVPQEILEKEYCFVEDEQCEFSIQIGGAWSTVETLLMRCGSW